MSSAVLVAITQRCHQIQRYLMIPHARTAHRGLIAVKRNISLKL